METKFFLTVPNALPLISQSHSGRSWLAEVHLVELRNRYPAMLRENLFLRLHALESARARDLPREMLSTSRSGLQASEFLASFTEQIQFRTVCGRLPSNAYRWCGFPLVDLKAASIYSFRRLYVQSTVFQQDGAHGMKRAH